MYYVDGDETLGNHYCFTPGPPSWSWDDFSGLDAALAPQSASVDPLNDQFLAATSRLMDDQRQSVDDQLARLLSSLEDGNVDDDDDEYDVHYGIPAVPYDDDLYDRIVNYVD